MNSDLHSLVGAPASALGVVVLPTIARGDDAQGIVVSNAGASPRQRHR